MRGSVSPWDGLSGFIDGIDDFAHQHVWHACTHDHAQINKKFDTKRSSRELRERLFAILLHLKASLQAEDTVFVSAGIRH